MLVQYLLPACTAYDRNINPDLSQRWRVARGGYGRESRLAVVSPLILGFRGRVSMGAPISHESSVQSLGLCNTYSSTPILLTPYPAVYDIRC